DVINAPSFNVEFDCFLQIRFGHFDRFSLGGHRQIKTASDKPFTIKLNRGVELSHGAKYPPRRIAVNGRSKACEQLSDLDGRQRSNSANYDFAKTTSNGRRDGVFERKSLTKPFSVRISTWPAARLAPYTSTEPTGAP